MRDDSGRPGFTSDWKRLHKPETGHLGPSSELRHIGLDGTGLTRGDTQQVR